MTFFVVESSPILCLRLFEDILIEEYIYIYIYEFG